MAVGNDIVDLRYEAEHALHPGFACRVLCDEEYDFYLAADNQFHFIWRAWAAKEASYKLSKQLDNKCIFSPSMFQIQSPDMTKLSYASDVFDINFESSPDYIYCVATLPGEMAFSEIVKVNRNHSETGVALIKRLVANTLKCDEAELLIRKNDCGIPQVHKNDLALSIPISITHHGNFVAGCIL